MSKNISKRDRFEVFKRDRFTCQYCGRKPPVVILNVDHVQAVSAGGKSEMMNLITACQDCNNGKSDRPLDRITIPVGPSAQERRDRLEQLQEYQRALEEERVLLAGWSDKIIERWCTLEGQPAESDSWNVAISFEEAVNKFVKRLMLEEILEAVEIAWRRFPDNERERFRYFCGVCWKKVRDNQAKNAVND